MYVRVYAYSCTHMHACIHTYLHTAVHTYIQANVQTYISKYMHADRQNYIYRHRTNIHTDIHRPYEQIYRQTDRWIYEFTIQADTFITVNCWHCVLQVLVVAVISLEHRKRVKTSGVLWMFWFILVLLEGVRLRSNISHWRFTVRSSIVVVIIVSNLHAIFGQLYMLHLLLFGRSRMIVGHHRLTDELFPAAAIFCSPYAL